MTPAFTPGPWRSYFSIRNQREKTGEWCFFAGEDGRVLLKNGKRSEADARLIAAAPEMYAALKQLADESLLQTLIDLDSSREEGEPPIASAAAKACLAAIAKVEKRT